MGRKKRPEKLRDFYLEELKKIQFRKEIIGIVILTIAMFLYIGGKHEFLTGIIGEFIFGRVLNVLIGQGKVLLPHFFGITGLLILFGSRFTREKTRVPGIIYGFIVYLVFLEVQDSVLTSVFTPEPIGTHAGGMIG